MPWTWSDAFGEDADGFKIIPSNADTFAFGGRFFEVRYLMVLIRGRIIQFGADVNLFAKSHWGGSFVQNSG